MRKTTIKKISLTALLLILVRFIAHIPVPWTDVDALKDISEMSFFSFSNLFSGGALQKFTFGAIGISSYISASITIQLLSFIVMPIRRAQKTPAGQMFIRKITLVLGIILSFSSSLIITYFLNEQYSFLIDNAVYIYIIIALCQTFGAMLTIIAGLYIEKEGIGNGISVLIFLNIIAAMPSTLEHTYSSKELGVLSTKTIIIVSTVLVAIYIASVFMQKTELRIRLINVYVPKDNKYINETHEEFFPMKMCYAGVMPAIFSQYTIAAWEFTVSYTGSSSLKYYSSLYLSKPVIYGIIFAVITIGYTSIASKIYYDFGDINRNLEQRGNLIDRVNPGVSSVKYIKKQHSKIIKVYIIYLLVIVVLPIILFKSLEFTFFSGMTVIVASDTSFELRTYIGNERRLYKTSKENGYKLLF